MNVDSTAHLNATVYIDGYGGRFSVAPNTDLAPAPLGPNARLGSLIAAHFRNGRLASNSFVLVREGPPQLIGDDRGEVLGIEARGAGQVDERWCIEFHGGRVSWPEGYNLQVVVPDRGISYQLAPSDPAADVLMFVRGPFPKSSFPSELVAPGQQVVTDTASTRMRLLELRYEHAGVAYRQLHLWRDLGDRAVLVTAQAIEGNHDAHFRAAESVAHSFHLASLPLPQPHRGSKLEQDPASRSSTMASSVPLHAPHLDTRNQATAQISDVLRSMLSPRVRIGRLRFGMRALGLVAMAYLLGVNPITLGVTAMVPSLVLDLLPWTITVCLAFTVLLWFQEVQRLHDLGYSCWYTIVRFVPVVNLIYWLALAVVGGQPFDNRFGAQPKHG